jgi:hypothetical protein
MATRRVDDKNRLDFFALRMCHKRTFAPQLALHKSMSALGHKRTLRIAIVTKVDRAAHQLLSRVINLCTD